MRNWKKIGFIGFIVILLFILICCDNGNGNETKPEPTYESVIINLPLLKMDTVKTIIGDNGIGSLDSLGLDINNAVDITYYGSGALFTVTVNGSNNPLQTVTWEIIGDVNYETKINNGLLTVNVNDHGKTINIKAISTADSSKYDEKTITVTQCLPSDFSGIWQQHTNNNIIITRITNEIEYKPINAHFKTSPIYWVAVINNGSNESFSSVDFPSGFFIRGVVSEVIEGDWSIGDIYPDPSRHLMHTNKGSYNQGNALYNRLN